MFRLHLYPLLGILSTTLLAAGCASAVNDSAICDGTASARTTHAAALAKDGGNLSIVTGATLIRMIDAGCKTTTR